MKVGDKVRIKYTKIETKIIRMSGKWAILKDKSPKHCCNFYSKDELIFIK